MSREDFKCEFIESDSVTQDKGKFYKIMHDGHYIGYAYTDCGLLKAFVMRGPRKIDRFIFQARIKDAINDVLTEEEKNIFFEEIETAVYLEVGRGI